MHDDGIKTERASRCCDCALLNVSICEDISGRSESLGFITEEPDAPSSFPTFISRAIVNGDSTFVAIAENFPMGDFRYTK